MAVTRRPAWVRLSPSGVILSLMQVRDAVEDDADALAGLADAPRDVMRNLVHDRTVRVAERPPTEAGPNPDVAEVERELLGFVSFDAERRTVYVTQLSGTLDACERLLAEPIRFATVEGMAVEVLVEEADAEIRDAVEQAGFEPEGNGPRFGGTPTMRYRLRP